MVCLIFQFVFLSKWLKIFSDHEFINSGAADLHLMIDFVGVEYLSARDPLLRSSALSCVLMCLSLGSWPRAHSRMIEKGMATYRLLDLKARVETRQTGIIHIRIKIRFYSYFMKRKIWTYNNICEIGF
jgi:hypothetical protein